MRRISLAAACAAALSLTLAAPAFAVTELDISDGFNADVVIGAEDAAANNPVDGAPSDYAFVSQSRADAACASPSGLPDTGALADRSATRPGITLEDTAHDNAGLNVVQLSDGGTVSDQWELPAPGRFAHLIVYATGGNGAGDLIVTAAYADGSSDTLELVVPDWYEDLGDGTETVWQAFDHGDRMSIGSATCQNVDTIAIFALRFVLDASKELSGLTVTRDPRFDGDTSRINIFGANLVRAYPLTVSRTGDGSGTIRGNGINCGTDCSQYHSEGSVVSLSAPAAAGSRFAGWSGACSGTAFCTVTMDRARSVTARFEKQPDEDTTDDETPPQDPLPQGPPQLPPAMQPAPQESEPETVAFRRIATAPALRGCAARKRLRVRIKRITGTDIASATVVAGGATKTFTPAGRRRAATFRNVPKAAFTVTVTVTTSDGRTLVATKKLRKCRAARGKKRAA